MARGENTSAYEGPVMFTCLTPLCRLPGKVLASILLCALGLGLSSGQADEKPRSPVVVKIQDDQPVAVDAVATGPVDPVQRIRFNSQHPLNASVLPEQGHARPLAPF